MEVIGGGTGQSKFAEGELLIGNASGSLSKNTIGSKDGNVTITSGNGTLLIDLSDSVGKLDSVSAKTMTAAGLPGATQSTRYVGATEIGAPTEGNFSKGDYIIDQTGYIWVCTLDGSPGNWAQVGGGGDETKAHVASVYETQEHAAATYLTAQTASSTYLNAQTASATYLTAQTASATYETIQHAMSIDSRITTLESSGSGSGSGIVTGSWTATMFVECEIGNSEPFTSYWNWVKAGSFVLIHCTGTNLSENSATLLSGAMTANINCMTALPSAIRPSSWSSASDTMVLRSSSGPMDTWQYQTACIQFSPYPYDEINSGIRMYYLSGGNRFTGWDANATIKRIVFPSSTFIYGL